MPAFYITIFRDLKIIVIRKVECYFYMISVGLNRYSPIPLAYMFDLNNVVQEVNLLHSDGLCIIFVIIQYLIHIVLNT